MIWPLALAFLAGAVLGRGLIGLARFGFSPRRMGRRWSGERWSRRERRRLAMLRSVPSPPRARYPRWSDADVF